MADDVPLPLPIVIRTPRVSWRILHRLPMALGTLLLSRAWCRPRTMPTNVHAEYTARKMLWATTKALNGHVFAIAYGWPVAQRLSRCAVTA